MAIHKEGYKILIVGFVILLVLNIIVGIVWSENYLLKWAFLIFSVPYLHFRTLFLPPSGKEP